MQVEGENLLIYKVDIIAFRFKWTSMQTVWDYIRDVRTTMDV